MFENYVHTEQNFVQVLPGMEILDNFFRERFIFFKPKQSLPSDLYWIKQVNKNKVFVAVADCNVHGNFVRTLGISLLNEIVQENSSLTAAGVLEILRERIKDVLRQVDERELFYDGMDMSAIFFDKSDLAVNFAGAYLPLYVISDNLLNIYKGDRQPIAAFIKEKKFTDNFIQVSPKTMIYMFSDGYIDQMSVKLRKFTIRRFQDMLTSIAQLPAQEQMQILESTLNDWIKGFKQIDDILILGMRV